VGRLAGSYWDRGPELNGGFPRWRDGNRWGPLGFMDDLRASFPWDPPAGPLVLQGAVQTTITTRRIRMAGHVWGLLRKPIVLPLL